MTTGLGRRKRGDIWAHFRFNEAEKKTECTITLPAGQRCGHRMAGKNTTNLKRHLEAHHREVEIPDRPAVKQPPVKEERPASSGPTGEVDPYTPVRIMAAAETSPLTTHVMNTGDGVPAAGMALSLHRLDSKLMIWNMMTVGTTNQDGRCPGLISRQAFTPGMYKLRFETGSYWETLGQTCFHPYVEIVFNISDPEQRFHLPLLMSRFSYSTYRGS